MYVGRFLVVAPGLAGYRVSSRSFPNREAVERDGAVTVQPTADAEPTDNPYVSYNCVQVVEDAATAEGEDVAVVGNGSHVDPVAEKLGLGYPARDALALALLALDFEKDDYDTPRIAAVVGAETAFVATVRRDALLVEEVEEPTLVATYEMDTPQSFSFEARPETPAGVAEALYGLEFEHAVCAAGVTADADGVEVATHNGK
jgi:IMP cyclohydrolase